MAVWPGHNTLGGEEVVSSLSFDVGVISSKSGVGLKVNRVCEKRGKFCNQKSLYESSRYELKAKDLRTSDII